MKFKRKKFEDMDAFYDVNNMASMSECTGLIPSAVEDEAEAEAYSKLYSIHTTKPPKQR